VSEKLGKSQIQELEVARRVSGAEMGDPVQVASMWSVGSWWEETKGSVHCHWLAGLPCRIWKEDEIKLPKPRISDAQLNICPVMTPGIKSEVSMDFMEKELGL
jgi:hypothetical protein